MRPAFCFPEPVLRRRVRHADECRERFEVAIAAKSRTFPSLGNASGCSCRHEGSLVMPCFAGDRYSLSGLAMCCRPMPDEPGVLSISSTIWRLHLEDARRRALPNG